MLKATDRQSLYGRNVYRVHIDAERRAKYSDQQIINIVDQYGDESYADKSFNFGGVVKKTETPDVYEVHVYTD